MYNLYDEIVHEFLLQYPFTYFWRLPNEILVIILKKNIHSAKKNLFKHYKEIERSFINLPPSWLGDSNWFLITHTLPKFVVTYEYVDRKYQYQYVNILTIRTKRNENETYWRMTSGEDFYD
jgi:hypothetical protein